MPIKKVGELEKEKLRKGYDMIKKGEEILRNINLSKQTIKYYTDYDYRKKRDIIQLKRTENIHKKLDDLIYNIIKELSEDDEDILIVSKKIIERLRNDNFRYAFTTNLSHKDYALCIYCIACRKLNIDYTERLYKKIKFNKKNNDLIKRLKRFMKIKNCKKQTIFGKNCMTLPDVKRIIDNLCEELKLENKLKLECFKLYNKIKDKIFVSPKAISGAIVYRICQSNNLVFVSGKLTNDKITKIDIAKRLGLGDERTINYTIKKLKENE